MWLSPSLNPSMLVKVKSKISVSCQRSHHSDYFRRILSSMSPFMLQKGHRGTGDILKFFKLIWFLSIFLVFIWFLSWESFENILRDI